MRRILIRAIERIRYDHEPDGSRTKGPRGSGASSSADLRLETTVLSRQLGWMVPRAPAGWLVAACGGRQFCRRAIRSLAIGLVTVAASALPSAASAAQGGSRLPRALCP